jgi:hypothetical protein
MHVAQDITLTNLVPRHKEIRAKIVIIYKLAMNNENSCEVDDAKNTQKSD